MKQSVDMMLLAEGEYRTAHRYRTLPVDRTPLRSKRQHDAERNSAKGRSHKSASRESARAFDPSEDTSH